MQVEEARNKYSETSTKMYNSVLDAHAKAKDLEETLKDLTKEVQGLVKEKEALENQRTEAITKHTELELDVKDLQEKIYGNNQAKVVLWINDSIYQFILYFDESYTLLMLYHLITFY